jgi:hypothetical protein
MFRGQANLAVWALILLGVLIAGLAWLYLWQGMVLARLRAERADLTLTLENLAREKLLLEHRLREAYSPSVLAERAQALGLGPADLSRIHYLEVEGEDGN